MFGFLDDKAQMYELRKETERLRAENESLTAALLELAELTALTAAVGEAPRETSEVSENG